ncbi:MAG TPA: M20/M25/M40 family metallo-hydrolase [Candidatus Eisenbacteria bacterium]|nr:M20/M25/M40 family metallo-hydrolase [Candidatus Eisenbacteria bacterium]
MKMNRKTTGVAAVLVCLLAAKAWPAGPDEEKNSNAAVDVQIMGEIRDHSELMANLEYLSDEIGPRLTGTPQLKTASDWTAEMFKKYGLTNVHEEAYTIPHAWNRGKAEARILAPTEHPLTIASAAWAPGTKGKVHGPVVYFDAKKPEDFDKFNGKLKGAIVIMSDPKPLSRPKPINQYAEIYHEMEEPPPPAGAPARPDPYERYLAEIKVRNQFLKEQGVLAVLRDANKPHALLNMTDATTVPFEMGPLTTAFITGEGYRMIFRMLKKGPVEVELNISNALSKKPVEVYNTVAEIRGTEKPDEVVILGGHLDSWDLATGSTDNGTGSMAVLEAARTLAKLNLKPKRTIRFILFTGEEQGLIGSEQYVKAHKAELDKISAALIHDSGTGRVLAIGLHDNYQDRAIVDQVIAPLGELKLLEPTMDREYGTDSYSFDEVGVPGFWCAQDLAEYPKTHHSQSDTFDKVWKDDINQGAQVLATWAYNTAELPEMMPRRAVSLAAPKTEAEVPPKADPIEEMDKKILEQVKSDEGQLKADLTYLTTNIGPRLTGSPQLDQASHWTEEQFKGLGLDNAHLESWSIANSWTRATASASVISPTVHVMRLAQIGWTPSTNGTIRGEVIGIEAEKPEDLEKYKGQLAGKILLVGRPKEMEAPMDPMLTPWGEPSLPINHPKGQGRVDYREYIKMRKSLFAMMAEEKAVAILAGSEKMFGLLNMGSYSRDYKSAPFPAAILAREDYLQLWRMLDAGGPVQVELNLQATFSERPVEVYNTVAEIRGTEKPDEVVILGAHLDSWDLGTGATDNGTGSMAVLEAARALQKLGVKPKRTIRFVLFTGEEQGLNGSRAYVQAHKDELPKISGVLIHDTGTGKVLTIGLMGNYNVRETIDRVMYPLAKPVGFMEPTLRSEGGSDHVPFDEAGVPGFWCVQEVADYDKMHHSQADVLDHVRWDDLTEGAQVLAVFAYNVAELPEMLPRKPEVKK